MANFLSQYFSLEGRNARQSRMSQYVELGKPFKFVVHAEVFTDHQGYHFVELDAEDGNHADNLAKDWCKHFSAMSCAVRAVNSDGSLSKPFRYFNPE